MAEWYTRSTKDAVEQSLGVQVPLPAPNMRILTEFSSCPGFYNFANICNKE